MCGPPLKDFDFNVSKQVRLQEGVGLEFRADLFNLFNHPKLNVPVNTAAVEMVIRFSSAVMRAGTPFQLRTQDASSRP